MARLKRERPPFLATVRSRRVLIGTGVVLGAALAGYAGALLLYPAPLVARDERVALVIGLPLEAATRELEQQGFRVKIASAAEPDPTVPKGYVTWQEPPGFVELPEGSQVELTVSDGPAAATVPDVLQFDLDHARRVLAAAGFAVGGIDSIPSAAEAGVVVSTRPAAGTPRQAGSRVEVVVSRGPAAIRIPDLVGMSETDARTRLDELGLRVGLVRKSRDGRGRPGLVLTQRPRPGVLSPKGGRVDLTVSDARTR